MSSIHHLSLNCRSLAVQEAFYTRHFGFKRARVFNPGKPDEFVVLRLGPACLELHKAAKWDHGGEQPVGFKHIAFEVENVERSVDQLKNDGITVEKIIDLSEILKGLRVCFFNDPEGNRVELLEGWQDE